MPPHTIDLRGCLEQECALVRHFIDVLHDEAQALEHPDDNTALQASTHAKNQCAESLAQVSNQRDALLAQQGLPIGKQGLDASSRNDPALAPLCHELQALAAEARRLNLENGAAIEIYLTHTQRAIQTLRNLAGTSNLYNAKGRAIA
ncbi:MAG TPA: flagellar protein FlgN [Burkholderiaceae bacterium]|nr:flagellar protein FlgN [Burkholderiaceae bacterium]